MKQPCFCGSDLNFSTCCKRYLAGRLEAPTPESLMRSRYTANVIQDAKYLFKTWHPSTRPVLASLKTIDLVWESLEIIKATHESGEETGVVEFIATYQQQSLVGQLHETSFFIREKAKWFYLNGEIH